MCIFEKERRLTSVFIKAFWLWLEIF